MSTQFYQLQNLDSQWVQKNADALLKGSEDRDRDGLLIKSILDCKPVGWSTQDTALLIKSIRQEVDEINYPRREYYEESESDEEEDREGADVYEFQRPCLPTDEIIVWDPDHETQETGEEHLAQMGDLPFSWKSYIYDADPEIGSVVPLPGGHRYEIDPITKEITFADQLQFRDTLIHKYVEHTVYEPFCSEMHPIAMVKLGEVGVGGMPKKKMKGRPKGKRRVYEKTAIRRGPGRHTTVRATGVVFPSEMRVRLPYTANGIITNAGATNIGQRWHTNAVYDVDPIFGSTATVGFYEISQLYHFYRVMGVKIVVELVNNESFPVIVYTIHSNNDLGTTGALAAAQSGNPMCRTTMLAPNGYGGATRIISTHTISSVVGSSAPLLEDNYRGLINGIPADLTWFGIYATAGPVNVFTVNKGISYAIRISMDTKFYGRTILTQ